MSFFSKVSRLSPGLVNCSAFSVAPALERGTVPVDLAFVPCAYLRCADPMPLWLALSYASVLLSRYLAVVLARRG